MGGGWRRSDAARGGGVRKMNERSFPNEIMYPRVWDACLRTLSNGQNGERYISSSRNRNGLSGAQSMSGCERCEGLNGGWGGVCVRRRWMAIRMEQAEYVNVYSTR